MILLTETPKIDNYTVLIMRNEMMILFITYYRIYTYSKETWYAS